MLTVRTVVKSLINNFICLAREGKEFQVLSA